MFTFCENCGAQYNTAKEQILSNPPHIQCRNCSDIIFLSTDVLPSKGQDAAPPLTKIRIMIVDDSNLIRRAFRNFLESDPQMEIVGEAENGKRALEMIPSLCPDVITLDVNMPVMDGITTLKHIMIKHPIPTIMISTLTKEGASISFDAVKYGAIDFIQKPSQIGATSLSEQYDTIKNKIISASQIEMEKVQYLRTPKKTEGFGQILFLRCDHIAVMGAAEGGYNSLLKIIPKISNELSMAMIVILYANIDYVKSFADYLNDISMLTVKPLGMEDVLETSTCYFASHEQVYALNVSEDEIKLTSRATNGDAQKKAIDNLMKTAGKVLPKKSIGVILSGSGDDGAQGIGHIIESGGMGLVQDPKSCLVKDMPISAIQSNEAAHVLSGDQIASQINLFLT